MNNNIFLMILILLLIFSTLTAQTERKSMETPSITKKLSTLSPAKYELKKFNKKGYKIEAELSLD